MPRRHRGVVNAEEQKGDDEVLTANEVAEHFDVTPTTLYRWIKKGAVPSPPRVPKGMRQVYVFTRSWVVEADQWIQAYVYRGNE